MSFLSRRRKQVGYDADPPRCETCLHYKAPGSYLRDSLPRPTPAICKRESFTVLPIACCDNWISRDGDLLEPDAA